MKKNRVLIGASCQLFAKGLLLFSISTLCFAQEPVSVLIIDGPVELENKKLSAYIDVSAMETMEAIDSAHSPTNWRDLNEQKLRSLKSTMSDERLHDQLDFLDAGAGVRDDFKAGAYFDGLIKYIFVPSWRKSLKSQSVLVAHGTSVAGLIVQPNLIGKLRLLVFPLSGETTLEKIRENEFKDVDQFINHEKEYISRTVSYISKAIRTQNIRLVNMSLGYGKREAKAEYLAKIHPSVKNSIKDRIKNIASVISQHAQEEFKRLFVENPNTVFVLAAGNDGRNLDSEKELKQKHLSQIQVKNLLVVGALNEEGKLASFSNYGENTVNVAAQGASVRSLRIGGGTLHAQGTSEAAPIVANKIAEIIYDYPDASSEEIVQRFYKKHTQRSKDLIGKIAQQRYVELSDKLGYIGSSYYDLTRSAKNQLYFMKQESK